jgi:hypothetical protein
MKFRDYIISSHRVRLIGPASDLVALGLEGFAPFEVKESDCIEPAIVEIVTGCDVVCDYAKFEELTRFDFDAGQATCIFSRSDEEFLFVMEQRGGLRQIYIFEKEALRVRCDVSECNDSMAKSLFRFGIWFVVGLALTRKECCAVHTSVIVANNSAVMFLGESGTGKSTHTRLWRENIEGVHLLNDDSPFVSVADGRVMVYGSPWSGKTPCYRRESFPLQAVVRLSQAPHNKIRRLKGIFAIGALLPSLPPAFLFDKELEERLMEILSKIVAHVPFYHLECLPDGDAAWMSYNAVYGENAIK